mmetsp:Transcript_38374/g.69152  ORF Transcript_38374/g.69152 Transcript_38374/m.69152 type:complete len:275 (+) Transcript_38374:281-1105(+)|eukprot:CAMPEP_0201887062 /NCGR_PEP_ID=MMETSP0902-20130614/23974_1 /ASSEMBLY_ACC=CAM_ASM_000551 /TAXON_ID=420261 /ORGANISM="Thalassiosira antarctica, Strain CCMP982" /LENGTH=274 /DNA_ID=CAMNT_0048416855 /DNA_START=168 /DNA_END=992 /DNA_ORIENTATION=-
MQLYYSILLLGLVQCSDARIGIERFLPKRPDGDTCSNISFPGNGFPSGKTLFKFNVLGRDSNWDGSFDPNGDRAIIVPLNGRTNIMLLNGDSAQDNSYDSRCEDCRNGDFCILDADGVNGDAEICVADPFASDVPCTDEYTETCDEPAEYAIFARTVGKGSASAGLCIDIDGDENCYVGSTSINPKKATDISQQLLTVCADGVKIGLFDAICKNADGEIGPCKGEFAEETDESYYWAYDAAGNRRAEFRFYDAALLNEITDTTCFGVTRDGAVC